MGGNGEFATGNAPLVVVVVAAAVVAIVVMAVVMSKVMSGGGGAFLFEMLFCFLEMTRLYDLESDVQHQSFRDEKGQGLPLLHNTALPPACDYSSL